LIRIRGGKRWRPILLLLKKQKGNYSAYCPDLPGCIATGKTEKETIETMKESIKFHLEGLRLEKMSIPKPSTQVTCYEVTV